MKRSARPICRAVRARCAEVLDTDQAKLYELIWIRTIASQMESAELERTTVDIAAKAGARMLDLRATGQVIKFDGFLTLYQEGKDDDGDDEDRRRLPAMSAGRSAAKRGSRRHAALHRAAAALLGSLAGQAHGRARHRPAFDLRLDPAGAEGPRLRQAGEEAAARRGQGPRRGRVPGELLRPLCRVRFHRRPREEQLDRISNNEISWREVLQRFLARLHRRGRRHQGSARLRGARRARRHAGAAHLSRPRRRRDPRSARPAAPASSIAEGRQVRRLRRLLELSGMPLHPPAGRRTARPAPTACSARIRRPVSTSR